MAPPAKPDTPAKAPARTGATGQAVVPNPKGAIPAAKPPAAAAGSPARATPTPAAAAAMPAKSPPKAAVPVRRNAAAPKPGAERAAPTPAPSPKRRRRRLFAPKVEHGLIATGIVVACASGAFGLYMNTRSDFRPLISGLQYLTVFAQLEHSQRAPAPEPSVADRFDKTPIDPVVTGTIPASPTKPVSTAPAPAALVDKTSLPLRGYAIRDVFDGMALVESRYGLSLVKPHAALQGAGQVLSIEKRDGKWVIVTTEGTISPGN